MGTYRTLDDYGEIVGPRAFKAIRAQILRDFKAGLIDRNNYEELMEDLPAGRCVARPQAFQFR